MTVRRGGAVETGQLIDSIVGRPATVARHPGRGDVEVLHAEKLRDFQPQLFVRAVELVELHSIDEVPRIGVDVDSTAFRDAKQNREKRARLDAVAAGLTSTTPDVPTLAARSEKGRRPATRTDAEFAGRAMAAVGIGDE